MNKSEQFVSNLKEAREATEESGKIGKAAGCTSSCVGTPIYLVTLSGENKSGKSLIEAVSEVSVKHKELNPGAVLFYSDMDEETLFGRLMECMFDLDLFLINLETGRTVSCLEDYSFLAESKGVRVVKDSEEGAPGEEED